MKDWLSKVLRWKLRTRVDGALWSAIFGVTSGALSYVLPGVFGGATSLLHAMVIGFGGMIGGLLGTLYWLPKENGS